MTSDQLFFIGALGFPPLAALMSFSIDYGSKGGDYDESVRDAKNAFVGALVVDAIIIALKLLGTLLGY